MKLILILILSLNKLSKSREDLNFILLKSCSVLKACIFVYSFTRVLCENCFSFIISEAFNDNFLRFSFILEKASRNWFLIWLLNSILSLSSEYKNSDSFKINSKSSNSSGKDKSFKEKKRKRVNSNNNENKDETKKLFNDILNICQNISNAQNNLIEIKKESAELLNEDNIETTIISGNKEVAKIYLNDNIVKKIYINKSNRTFTEEKEICDSLKKIKRELNKVLNKLTKNK